MTFRLLAVHAHPDDESSKGAATSARYVAEGVEVLVVSCTGGERGDILNPSFGRAVASAEEMAVVRREEMAAAAAALGIRHRWLGFVDSGLPEGDPLPPLPEGSFATLPLEVTAAPLVEVVREFRPHVMTTYDPQGGYPHPDHIRCHDVSVEAFRAAAHAGRYEGTGAPWKVAKLYYNHDFSMARVRALHEAMVARSMDSPYAEWIERVSEMDREERPVTTKVRIDAHYASRDAALRAHASQIDPAGFFFAVPRDLEAQVWPHEDFELAASRVPTQLPEDDLFAGIDPAQDDDAAQAAMPLDVPVAGEEDEA